jgi:hypothetical protein
VKRTKKSQIKNAGCQSNLKYLNGDPLPNLAKLKFRHLKQGEFRTGASRKA